MFFLFSVLKINVNYGFQEMKRLIKRREFKILKNGQKI